MRAQRETGRKRGSKGGRETGSECGGVAASSQRVPGIDMRMQVERGGRFEWDVREESVGRVRRSRRFVEEQHGKKRRNSYEAKRRGKQAR